MYKKKVKNTVIKANCGASVKAHGKMKLQSGGMIGKIKKNEVFGTEEKRQENLDKYMRAYNKGGAIGSSRGDTPEEEDIRAARRSNANATNNNKERNNGRQ